MMVDGLEKEQPELFRANRQHFYRPIHEIWHVHNRDSQKNCLPILVSTILSDTECVKHILENQYMGLRRRRFCMTLHNRLYLASTTSIILVTEILRTGSQTCRQRQKTK